MKLLLGDCLEVLKTLPDNSVDSVVTDPPYELGFMGKSWDNTGIANNVDMWRECLRVLKPGGHLLAFSGTRTYHRMACAIEDAGFEVRDMIEWVYGSGFPKSLNIGKAVDKLQGNEREVVGVSKNDRPNSQVKGGKAFDRAMDNGQEHETILETKGTSEWEGWGTALKPAHEPICMARKPLAEKTVAENCLKWGTGGINIDGCRVDVDRENEPRLYDEEGASGMNCGDSGFGNNLRKSTDFMTQGRFPANLLHDNSEEVRECFPETKSGGTPKIRSNKFNAVPYNMGGGQTDENIFGNSGNASRFFKSIIYTAKASKSERNRGCDNLDAKPSQLNSGGISRECSVEKRLEENGENAPTMKNNHPTVKSVALMEYLINMITPKGGVVLDPFMGSGSTGVACKNLKREFIGIEKEAEYIKIAEARIAGTPERLF